MCMCVHVSSFSQLSPLPMMITLLVLLSRDVFEVRQVFLLLTSPGTPCCLTEVVELFYCLATLFYHLWRQDQVLPQRYSTCVCINFALQF